MAIILRGTQKYAYFGLKWQKNGLKMAEKWSKNGQKYFSIPLNIAPSLGCISDPKNVTLFFYINALLWQ
jgi:hypothetical protein